MRMFVVLLLLAAAMLWVEKGKASADAPDRADVVVMDMAEIGPGEVLILPQAVVADHQIGCTCVEGHGLIMERQTHNSTLQTLNSESPAGQAPANGRAYPLLCFSVKQAARTGLNTGSRPSGARRYSALG